MINFNLSEMKWNHETNFDERSEPAPDGDGKLESAGAAQSNDSTLVMVT